MLAAHLAAAGLEVWYDYELASGDRWQHVIRDQINDSAAFVVVMTPEAEQSVWVEREIIHAEEHGTPIFPLLLRGQRFFRLNNLQFEQVTNGRLPDGRFLDR